MEKTTFTLRDLNRRPAKVLAACDRFGSVQIRTRDGRKYVLESRREDAAMPPLPNFKARRARLRELGLRPLSKEQQRHFDKWIAGEE